MSDNTGKYGMKAAEAMLNSSVDAEKKRSELMAQRADLDARIADLSRAIKIVRKASDKLRRK